MPDFMESKDAINGKKGRAYAKIDGNNELLFMAKTIEATAEKAKSEIKSIGRRMTGHKAMGLSGSGTMTIYYVTPLFRGMMKNYKDTGVDTYFDLVVENDDPASAAGKQTALLIDCNIDSVLLAKLDGDSDDALDEEVAFTFEDFDFLNEFKKI